MSVLRSPLAILILVMIASHADSAEHQYLKAFPQAAEGMVRYVIVLPEKERGEEDAFRVELIVGQTMMTDGVNKYSIAGNMEELPLKGWGFMYYEVKELGPVRSTLIGVPPGTPPVEKFVQGPSKLIRYNSRVPIVIYVPQEAEVQYRIFQAAEAKKAEKG